MAIKTRKPRNSSLRYQSYTDSSDITKHRPEKKLTIGLKKRGGRNAYGRITVRHRGGGAIRKYRVVDFKRSERDVPGRLIAVEYDPNRNVRIGLVSYANGVKRYMLMPENLKVGSVVEAGERVEPRVGNALPLKNIPVGFSVHNVELNPRSGGTFARSAGSSVQIVAKADEYATVKLPSGEIRLVHQDCWATVGVLGNADHKNIVIGKAGRTRHKGFRPTVRGMAMNPIDHPHGGGEGRSKSGAHPTTPWGKGCKGTRTRKKKNPRILKRRKK
ncbi:50S ribosomal protein L2 [Candidatus Babeliales bacterium]|nr:50S ribosomal protein L2 [Candidatus Babeliales bacterium]